MEARQCDEESMMSLSRLTWLAALCAVAASAATCAQAAGPALTVSQYRHEANAICSDFNAFKLPGRGALVARLQALVDKGRGSLAALRRLQPPQSLAKLHGQIVVVNAERVGMLASLVSRLKAGQITLTQLADHVARSPFAAQSNALWKQAGAFSCVQY
jgi:hypothetical protein